MVNCCGRSILSVCRGILLPQKSTPELPFRGSVITKGYNSLCLSVNAEPLNGHLEFLSSSKKERKKKNV
jgi:hypothetical protein